MRRIRQYVASWRGVIVLSLVLSLALSVSRADSQGGSILPVPARGSVIAVKALQGQNNAIATANMVTQPAAGIGMFRYAWFVVVKATGTATNLVLTLGYTDPSPTARTITASTVSCAALNETHGQQILVASSSIIPLTYATSISGTCIYDVYLSVEQLSQ